MISAISKSSKVCVDDYGMAYCSGCGVFIFRDDNGDMPERCPRCYQILDYTDFDPSAQEVKK